MVITFLGIAVNELLFSALFKKDAKKLVLPVAIGVVICLYGAYRVREYNDLHTAHANDSVFHASIAQGNIGDFTKVAAERGERSAVSQVIGEYIRLSEQAIKSVPVPDAVIWPETAYPAIFERPFTQAEIQMEQMIHSLISHYKGYLIFGGYDNDVRGLDYNSVFFVKSLPPTSEPSPDRVEKEVYHKSTLLMFGETLPFANQFPAMKNWFPTMGFFGSGPGPEVMSIKNSAGETFKFAPSICYEGLFVDFSALGALQGADALLNVTNDSWFGEHGEPYQHLSLTRFRSIETRLPMIRATNTGFSVWIDPLGEQVKSTELFKASVLDVQVQHRFFPESPYLVVSRYLGPNWLIRFFQTLSFALIAIVWFTNKRSPSR
jgi:apolipoprotein N-acyltransferase